MTTPAPAHRRITFSGEFQSFTDPAYEQWSFRLNLGIGETTPALELMATTGADAYGAHLKQLFPSHVKLLEVKAAEIGPDGRYASAPAIVVRPTPGTGPAVNLPPQVCVAVSLVTERRGASGRGRFYLPTPSFIPLASDGRISQANAQTITNQAAAFLSALNGPAGFGNVVVASTKGFTTVVTAVRVGRVLDTIRSRRTSIDELHTVPLAVAQ